MLRRYPGTDFITGLRAYAALFVVMIHAGAFSQYGDHGANFTNAGKYGVQIFFVIAGFSITASYLKVGQYGPYFLQRFFRIWPVYVVVLGLYLAAISFGVIPPSSWQERFGAEIDAYNILMHVTFLSFLDYRIANSIIGVEWSIPVEFFWYVFLPVVLVRGYSYRGLLIAAILLIVLRAGQRVPLDNLLGQDGNLAATWMPIRHGAHFILGVVAFKLRSDLAHVDERFSGMISTIALVAIPVVMLSGTGLSGDIIAVATAVLIAFYRDSAVLPRILLSNRVALTLGTISYSIYLLHMLVIGLFSFWASQFVQLGTPTGFAVVAAVTAVLAAIFYATIERPMIRAGRHLSGRMVVRSALENPSTPGPKCAGPGRIVAALIT